MLFIGSAIIPSTTAFVKSSIILIFSWSVSPSIDSAFSNSFTLRVSMSLNISLTTGSTSSLFIWASSTDISSLIIFSAFVFSFTLFLMFLSTISAIWSRFIIFIPWIVVTFSSTVLGFDKSSIIIPVFLSFIASLILSNVTKKYGAIVATNNTS